jgi:hypothetical protein
MSGLEEHLREGQRGQLPVRLRARDWGTATNHALIFRRSAQRIPGTRKLWCLSDHQST